MICIPHKRQRTAQRHGGAPCWGFAAHSPNAHDERQDRSAPLSRAGFMMDCMPSNTCRGVRRPGLFHSHCRGANLHRADPLFLPGVDRPDPFSGSFESSRAHIYLKLAQHIRQDHAELLHSLERLSSIAVSILKPSERGTHIVGSITQGLGNV